jgi:hypothetical protein
LLWVKKAIFFAEFFGKKNIFLNHNIGPRLGEFSHIRWWFYSDT